MKKKNLFALLLFVVIFWSCTTLPKLTVTPNSKYLFKDQISEKMDTKLSNTNFACKKNFYWFSQGIIGFDGVFYDELIKKYSIGDPVFVEINASSTKVIMKTLGREEIDSIAQVIGNLGYTKVGKVNVGATIGRNVFRALNQSGTIAEQRNFEGAVYNQNHEHKITFEGFVVENSGTYKQDVNHGDEVSKITFRFKRENDQKAISFSIKNIPPFALDIENYWLYMQVSSDGNYIKFGQELLDLKNDKQETIWKGGKTPKFSNLTQAYVYNEGICSIISPNWKNIGFIYVDYYLAKLVLGMKEIQKACKEADLKFYSFKY